MLLNLALGAVALAAIVVAVLAARRRGPDPEEGGFRKVLDATQVGVTVTDIGGAIVYTNPADAAMHGYAPGELIGKPASIFGPPTTRRTVTTGEINALESWQREGVNARKDGTTFPVRLRTDVVKDDDGRVSGVVTVCEDITDEKRMQAAQAAGALQDPLTGLANRTFFLELVKRAIRRAGRHAEYEFAVLHVDLDRFSLINESLGHDAGDALLRAVAERLRAVIRPNDVAARIAGDEFVVLLDDLRTPPGAITVAERVIAALDAAFTIGEREVYVTCNVGIVHARGSSTDAEEYLKDARSAMYAARNAGRNQFREFEETARRRATQRLQLETDLRKAIDEEELRAVYQPIVDLGTAHTVGFEALVRWHHRQRGTISPGEFIPAAEESGLVVPIGWWMVDAACAQVAGWAREFPAWPITVNVNLSVRQLRQPRLCERIVSALDVAGVPAGRFKLEVTESMLMEDADTQIETLRELRAAGVGVVIDDFGTGYSSLSYLQRFAFDVLKIDRSFLPTTEGAEGWDLVRTIIDLAHDQGAAVVAEGIETEHHAARLRELGCDWGQGFWYARPLDPEAATARLREEHGATARDRG